MLFLILLFLLDINTIYADIIHELKPHNIIDDNNIIVTSLWAFSVFASVGLISKFKNLGITIKKNDDGYWKDYFELDINDYDKIKILRKQLKELDNTLLSFEKNTKPEISDDIIYKYGNGPIRFIEGNKYYHGVNNTNEKTKRKGKIINGEGWSKCIFEYTSDRKKTNVWDTKNINDYCCNFSFDPEKTKGRRVFKVYKCNGHPI